MDKDKMLQHADDLLKFILDGLEQGKEFAMEQAPLVVKEVITWGIVEHAMWLVISASLLVLAAYLFRYLMREYKKVKGTYYCAGDGHQFGMGLTIFASVILTVVAIVNAIAMMKAIVAPRLYLLGELRDLLR